MDTKLHTFTSLFLELWRKCNVPYLVRWPPPDFRLCRPKAELTNQPPTTLRVELRTLTNIVSRTAEESIELLVLRKVMRQSWSPQYSDLPTN